MKTPFVRICAFLVLAFCHEHAQAAQDPIDRLRINGLALTNPGNEVVTVHDIFANGDVYILRDGASIAVKATTALIPENNGLDDLWSGKLALMSASQIVRVKAVFDDGRAQIVSASGVKTIEAGLIPEVWRYADRHAGEQVLTADNREWTIVAVFKNGKVLAENNSTHAQALIAVATAVESGLNQKLIKGRKGLTATGQVVDIVTVYEDGRAKVSFSNGTEQILAGVIAEADGLNGFYRGGQAVRAAPSEERFNIQRVFENGAVLAVGNAVPAECATECARFVTGLIPEVTSLGNLRRDSRAITIDNAEVYIRHVFKDGRAIVEQDTLTPLAFASGLAVEENGKNGLYTNRRALTPSGQTVSVSYVYSDGRASYYDPTTQQTLIRSDLIPSVGN